MTVTFAQKQSQVRPLYETDFHKWAAEQARAIRDGRVSAIDWDNVAEEIESLGRRDRRALENHLEILIAHLLKCMMQSDRRTASWYATIREQRKQIARLLERNPSLRTLPKRYYDAAYGEAIRRAVRDTGLGEESFPEASPFTPDEALDPDFLPGSDEGRAE